MNRTPVPVALSLAGALLVLPQAGAAAAVDPLYPDPDADPVQLVVKVDSPQPGVVESVASAHGLVVEDAVLASRGIYLAHASDGEARLDRKKAKSLAKKVAKHDRVVFAEVNAAILVDDTQFSGWPYGQPEDLGGEPGDFTGQPLASALDLSGAHEVSRGAGTVVAVLDTGVDALHPALAGDVHGGWNYVDDDADTRDVAMGVDTNQDGAVDDAVGHGTFVAGLVSLVAPSARIAPYRILDSDGVGSVYLAIQAIVDATADGADVINLSFGSPTKSESKLLAQAIKDAEKAGAVVVAAAGNDGTDGEHYPAAQSEVLGVSALDDSAVALFSCRGKWVDVAAPGVDVVGPVPGGRYARWAGTSTSAPLVSGEVALLRAVAPTVAAKKLRGIVKKTGRKLPKPPDGVKADTVPPGIDITAALTALQK